MDIQRIYTFLGNLAQNNTKEWFDDNREEYQEVKKIFEAFVQSLINRIALVDPSVMALRPKDCTYRIYRDIRFSPDKTPYKTHMGAYINPKGKKSPLFGYYIHLEPGNSLVGGGSICLPTKLLTQIRENIYNRVHEYISIVENPDFKKFFPIVGEDFLKTAPKGFSKDYEYIDYLRCKEYICSYRVDDSYFTSGGYIDQIGEPLQELKHLAEFINSALDGE